MARTLVPVRKKNQQLLRFRRSSVIFNINETVEFQVGDKVKHTVFGKGKGTVTELLPTGILQIRFEDKEKSIAPEYAVNAELIEKISGV